VKSFSEVMNMVTFYLAGRRLKLDRSGQDLIEYALLAASISMAAGAFLPQWVGPTISAIFSKVTSCLNG
jgi:Flp pilus assembly pilin Flp